MAAYYEPPYAAPVYRLVAFVFDSLLLLLTGGLVYAALLKDVADPTGAAALLGLDAIYYIGFGIAKGGTPVKLALKMRITAVDGTTPTPDVFILRYLVFFLTTIVPVGVLISLFVMLRDPERRAIHDRIAGTIVVWSG